MSEFQTYLQLGLEHISDLAAYDHMLFLLALCAIYRVDQWKQVLILVTAFTLGHSITLALAVYKLVSVPGNIIEFLIPVTILLTCIYNFFTNPEEIKGTKLRLNYLMAVVFGLIHGLGFSNYLRMLLGKEESLFKPLLAFNIGLELGQLLIVGAIMVLLLLVLHVLKVKHRVWNYVLSGIVAIMAIHLMIGVWPF